MEIQPAVKQETGRVAAGAVGGSVIMLLVFWALHQSLPGLVPFDWRVVLSAAVGCAVAVGNFFFMGLTVQKITSAEDNSQAYQRMRASYRTRTLVQLVWVILALAAPAFNGAAGIIPLFLPGLWIKARGIFAGKKGTR